MSMTMDVQLLYLLPLLSVFIGLAWHLWYSANHQFPHSGRRLLFALNLGLCTDTQPIVQPILRIIRTVRRKLLMTGDRDEEAPSLVLL